MTETVKYRGPWPAFEWPGDSGVWYAPGDEMPLNAAEVAKLEGYGHRFGDEPAPVSDEPEAASTPSDQADEQDVDPKDPPALVPSDAAEASPEGAE